MRTEVTYFNDVSKEYLNEYGRETPEGYSFRVRREKVLALLEDGTGKHILDLAAGPGIMIKGLRAKGYRVTCIDAAPDMVALAKIEAGNDPLVTCEVGDAYALSYEDEAFDVLTAMGLIEYLDDEPRFLKEAARVTKRGGRVIITVPNVWSPWRIWNRLLRALVRIFKPAKSTRLLHREYTLARMKKLMAAHGLTYTRAVYYNFKLVPYPLDRFFPRFTVAFSKLCEHLDRTPLKFLGTASIVEARRD